MRKDQPHNPRSDDAPMDLATSRNGPSARSDVADDGQEEVFSRTAVDHGLVEDPRALAPEDLAKTPKSPGRLTDEP